MKDEVYSGPTRMMAMGAAFFVFCYGLWIVLPFAAFKGHPPYALLNSLAPETFWGILFMACGLFRFVGTIKDKYHLVKTSTFVTFLLWIFLELSFIYSDWSAPLVVIGAYLIFVSGHHYVLVKRPKNLPNNKAHGRI